MRHSLTRKFPYLLRFSAFQRGSGYQHLADDSARLSDSDSEIASAVPGQPDANIPATDLGYRVIFELDHFADNHQLLELTTKTSIRKWNTPGRTDARDSEDPDWLAFQSDADAIQGRVDEYVNGVISVAVEELTSEEAEAVNGSVDPSDGLRFVTTTCRALDKRLWQHLCNDWRHIGSTVTNGTDMGAETFTCIGQVVKPGEFGDDETDLPLWVKFQRADGETKTVETTTSEPETTATGYRKTWTIGGPEPAGKASANQRSGEY